MEFQRFSRTVEFFPLSPPPFPKEKKGRKKEKQKIDQRLPQS